MRWTLGGRGGICQIIAGRELGHASGKISSVCIPRQRCAGPNCPALHSRCAAIERLWQVINAWLSEVPCRYAPPVPMPPPFSAVFRTVFAPFFCRLLTVFRRFSPFLPFS